MGDPVRDYLATYGPPPSGDPVESYLAKYRPPPATVSRESADASAVARSRPMTVAGLLGPQGTAPEADPSAVFAEAPRLKPHGSPSRPLPERDFTAQPDVARGTPEQPGQFGKPAESLQEALHTVSGGALRVAQLIPATSGLASATLATGEAIRAYQTGGSYATALLDAAFGGIEGVGTLRSLRRGVAEGLSRGLDEGLVAPRGVAPESTRLPDLPIRASMPPEEASLRRVLNERRAKRRPDAEGLRPEEETRFRAEALARGKALLGNERGALGVAGGPGFRSRLVESVKASKLDRAPAQTWVSKLRGQGHSADEFDWALGEALSADPRRVWSKAEIADLAERRGYGALEETVLSEKKMQSGINRQSKYAIPEVTRLVNQAGDTPRDLGLTLANDGDAYRALTRRFPELAENEDWAEVVARDVFGGESRPTGSPKFGQYTEPGGTNYREVLLQVPKPTELPTGFWVQQDGQAWRVHGPKTSAEGPWYGKAAPSREAAIAAFVEKRPGQLFTSSHWDEPNVLAHVRMNDRVGPNGEKILHVEEIQSDWHQKGRKSGYKGGPATAEELATAQARADQAAAAWQAHADVTPAAIRLQGGAETTRLASERMAADEALSTLKSKGREGVPNAPLKETPEWMGLGMKRALDEAVAGGYDAVSWTPGAKQAARYDLSKHIAELHYSGSNLVAYGHDGSQVISKTGVSPSDLPEIIGKEAAERLMAQPQQGTLRSLTGLQLSVGGEGMKAFYDEMLPNWIKGYAKKLGVRIEVGPTPQPVNGTMRASMTALPDAPMLRIAPELRAAIGKGQSYGKGGVTTLTGLTGAGLGATAGAKNDPEHPVRGAVIGGLAGAVAGGLIGHAAERPLGEKGTVPAAAERVRPTAPPPLEPEALRQGPLRRPEETALRMANLPEHLQEEVRSLGRTLQGPGSVESYAQVQRKAAQLLNGGEVGIDFTKGDRFETLGAASLMAKRVEEANEVAGLARNAATDTERAGFETRRNALLDEATRLYSSISKSGTEAGRNLSARKAIANLSNVPAHWEYEARKVAERPLADTETATIRKLLGENKRAEMLRYIGTLRPSTTMQKVFSTWKGWLLSAIPTQAGNIGSNLGFAMSEEAARNSAAFSDWLMTKFIGGERMKTPTSMAILKASAEGALKGVRQIPNIMRGLPVGHALEIGEIPRETNFGHPLLNTAGRMLRMGVGATAGGLADSEHPVRGAVLGAAVGYDQFRLLNAMDAPFFEAALRGSLAEQATILAKAEGLRGSAAAIRIKELIHAPSDEMAVRGLQDAAVRTYKDRTPLGDLLRKGQEKFPITGNIVVPFTGVPGSVATKFGEYTPYGFIKSTRLYRQAVKESIDNLPNPALKQRAAETFGRASAGVAPLVLGAWMWHHHRATGQVAAGAKSEQDTQYLLGKPNDAFLIGGQWVEANRLGPYAMMVSLGAVMAQQAEKAHGSMLAAASGAAFGAARTVTDQPFLTGVEALKRAATDEESAGRYLANLSGSLVPSVVGAAERARDPVIRDARTVAEKMQSRVPIIAEQVPGRNDQLGHPSERSATGVQNFYSPVRFSPDRVTGNPILEAIQRSGAVIPALKRDLGESSAAYSARSRATGQAVERNVRMLVQSPTFQRADQASQKDQLENMVTRVRQQERKGTGRPERPEQPNKPMRPVYR